MRFEIDTSGTYYNEKEAAPLRSLGFMFEPSKCKPFGEFQKVPTVVHVDVDSIDDLEALSRRFKCSLVISFKDGPKIEIYDDYRE